MRQTQSNPPEMKLAKRGDHRTRKGQEREEAESWKKRLGSAIV
jgi:hypothetical protein